MQQVQSRRVHPQLACQHYALLALPASPAALAPAPTPLIKYARAQSHSTATNPPLQASYAQSAPHSLHPLSPPLQPSQTLDPFQAQSPQTSCPLQPQRVHRPAPNTLYSLHPPYTNMFLYKHTTTAFRSAAMIFVGTTFTASVSNSLRELLVSENSAPVTITFSEK